MVRPFHLIGRSFHSFSVKLYVKRAFLASWLQELGIHMSNTLVSACGLKTCEKFRLKLLWNDMTINEKNLDWNDLTLTIT